MAGPNKVLILDDDEDFLRLYAKLLSQQVPSAAGVLTSSSCSRAFSLLESESIGVLITDLNLPHMDGLQVISVVRRKFPQIRIMVLTGIRDEQFRSRAYAMGVDQYWIKPENEQEIGLLLESIETLLRHETQSGFRGIQNKSLADIIQLECLAQSTSLLRVRHGTSEGRIWLVAGEVYDAEAPGLQGEPAVQRILGWRGGTFESLPLEEKRPRTIFTSIQGLLLNSAQAQDEASSAPAPAGNPNQTPGLPALPPLSELAAVPGTECAVALGGEKLQIIDQWALHNPEPLADWTRQCLVDFRALGEHLQAGSIQQLLAKSPVRKLVILPLENRDVCVGLQPNLSLNDVQETIRQILLKWAS